MSDEVDGINYQVYKFDKSCCVASAFWRLKIMASKADNPDATLDDVSLFLILKVVA